MLFHHAMLPLSHRTLNYAAGVIRRRRRAIGSRWRKLNPAQQALLVLAYLRKGETFADLAARFTVSTTRLRAPGERANAQLKSGASRASPAAAPGAQAASPKPSTSCKPANHQMKHSVTVSPQAQPAARRLLGWAPGPSRLRPGRVRIMGCR